jgi:hypothetical protein
MESTSFEGGLADRVLHHRTTGSTGRGRGPQVEQELSAQLDTVHEMADFCTYLTSDRVSPQARQLVDLAHALYEETTAELRRSRPSR